jgi:L-aminopeptidase/D-esterase-like protein
VYDALTDVAGLAVGHAHDLRRLTGCTVILCEGGAVAGVDVRGAAPGTRETDLCRPGALVERAHAVLLTGGSAFGLDAASGVMRRLWERGVGYDAGVARVPIVPAAVIFDLALGEVAWPDGELAYEACRAASTGEVAQGCVGAGAGASVGKLLGPLAATKTGVGTASVRVGERVVAALVVVNALGDVVDPATGEIVAGARDPDSGRYANTERLLLEGRPPPPPAASSTTIGVVATDAGLSVEGANHLARAAHNGLARTIRPCHTMYDGDTLFALATGQGAADSRTLVSLATAAAEAVGRAVLRAAERATPAGGLPAGRRAALNPEHEG